MSEASGYFAHHSAFVDEGTVIGAGTQIWHVSHIMKGTTIGENCSIGQNVVVGPDVVVGKGVKIQNNVAVYKGVILEDYVFCGPSMVFTNILNPRSEIPRMQELRTTLVRRGASLGANCTILCGVTVGRYAFVAAGAVVTKDIPDYGLVMGSSAKQAGWMSRHGHRMTIDDEGLFICPQSGFRYKEVEPNVIRCLDLDENAELPVPQVEGRDR